MSNIIKMKRNSNIILDPCDSCSVFYRYMIGKTSDGKIIRFNCKDKCQRHKDYVEKVVKNMMEKIKEKKCV
jgi:hypothetical protein